MGSIRVRTGAWFDEKIQQLELPETFTIHPFYPKNARSLSEKEIREHILSPAGPSLDDLCRTNRRIVFVVDDLGRPTPAYQIIPHLLDILHANQILDADIRFLIATGSHRQLSRREFELKLGKDIVDRYRVENHDAINSQMKHLGFAKNGFPVVVNSLIMDSDLAIGIGCIIPHACHGFGGGAKLFCPGVAGMESIVAMHGFTSKRGRARSAVSDWDMRLASEAFAAFLPPIFLVNAILTTEKEICGLFAGHFHDVFERGQEAAARVYETRISSAIASKIDVVLANFYPLDSDPVQSGKSPWIPKSFPNALIIQINSTADGIDYHGWKLLRRSSWVTLVLLLIGEGLSLRFMPSVFQKLPAFPPIRWIRSRLIRWMIRRAGVDYQTFLDRMKRVSSDENVRIEEEPTLAHKPWIFSQNYPYSQFKKKYPNGALLRTWSDVVSAIERHFPKANIAVIPSAPVQIPVSDE